MQYSFTTILATLALVSTTLAAPTTKAATVTIQLDGKDPAGEDSRQHDVPQDNSVFVTPTRNIIGAQIIEGSGTCKLYSDAAGLVSLKKPFTTTLLDISPAVSVNSVRCVAWEVGRSMG